MESTTQTTGILSHLQGKAISAHQNTSFSPERRGVQMINDYGDELAADMTELKDGGASDESVSDYKSRYERFFTSYLHAKSNTFSVMITGGGNFPVRRHQKANRSEQRHYEIFREWRQRAKKAILRKAKPPVTYTSELERYRTELAGMQRNQQLMKDCNAIIRKAKGADCTDQLISAGLSAENAAEILKGGKWWGKGFAPFSLTNNNANMKRVEQQIKLLETKEAIKQNNPITRYNFEGGYLLVNYEVDRLQIFFDSRPSKEQLDEWKQKGLNSYNWSPTAKAWQRKITPNAMYHVKNMLPKLTKVS